MERYICVHGHFYQPPRENPWLEVIELQDSAYPYHDWNERITAESYAPNAVSRILDEEGQIVEMANNYAKISFNFGPTLLAWLESQSPQVYTAIQIADQISQKNFSGHGSALAQAYNHMILPLANERDKRTQILWGLRDFEHRFKRQPEGMWLPETAVDLETLTIMAENGIRFTILAPHQAQRVRDLGTTEWHDVGGATIDPTRAYTISLGSRQTMAVFFYDGPIARAVAFEGLLKSGESFAKRLLSGFAKHPEWPQIVHIATDGETYGHHHRFGDMALAYATHYIESKNLARLTNYGEYLEKNPPTREVEIVENTSWSCSHGVERWKDDCGCNSGAHPHWRQGWRAPLRKALDWLRDTLAGVYEDKARLFLEDPWEARDDGIHVVLDRSGEEFDAFLNRHATRALEDDEKILVRKLLEMERHTMLMYTSCGWFFDDLSGIETVQVIQYAGRAIQLAQEASGTQVESHFLELLENAKSNIPNHRDGRRIYEKLVRPAMVDLEKVAAHYAVSSLFEDYEAETSISCYTVKQEGYESFEVGRAKLAMGRAQVASEITHESDLLCFGVLHMGDHNINSGVRQYQSEEAYGTLMSEASEAFERGDLPETLRIMDKHFGASAYSLRSLFRDEQRKILDLILEPTLQETQALYYQLYERHALMLRFLRDSDLPVSKGLFMAAEFALNENLRRAFKEEEIQPEHVENLLEEVRALAVHLDTDTLEYALRQNLEQMAQGFIENPTDMGGLQNLVQALLVLEKLPFQVNLWKVQNICYEILKSVYPEFKKKADGGSKPATEWIGHFSVVADKLSVRVQ
jgi:alpha-amylase/alpha-mannosidase (GH57 family)